MPRLGRTGWAHGAKRPNHERVNLFRGRHSLGEGRTDGSRNHLGADVDDHGDQQHQNPDEGSDDR